VSNFFDQLSPSNPLSRIRRNHGLEHATIHLLSAGKPNTSMAGYSDAGGFWILGDLRQEEIETAAKSALQRMRNGEHRLAVHPNCGTNFATSGFMAGGAAALVMLGVGKRWEERLERLSLAVMLATVALIFSRPLGFRLQSEITTSGNPGDLEIVRVYPSRRGQIKAHRVITRG